MYGLPAIDAALTGTIFAGKLHYTRVTASTNSDAMAAARTGAPHGSVWLADEQTQGRGRGGHQWHSSAGNGLYVSVLLRPEFLAARLPLLPLAAGLAAADAIRTATGAAIDLRWPNDLLIGPRKVGGILVESAGTQGKGAFAVVGIGINMHQREFAPDLDTPATSLDIECSSKNIPQGLKPSAFLDFCGTTEVVPFHETSHETSARVSRGDLLIALLKSLEREAQLLASSDAAVQIPVRIEQASSWVRGRAVSVHGPQACEGITAGLDENGFLRVATNAGLATVQTGGIRAAVKE